MAERRPQIIVTGRATVPAEPDEVQLELSLDAVKKSADDALADVAERSETLERLFAELSIDRSAWSTSGVSVGEYREWTKDKYALKGYRAANRLSLRLKGASVVGALMRRATAEADARIAGPYWRVARDNPARAEAYRAAALDARRRAEAYAAALGVSLGEVLKVREPRGTTSVAPQMGVLPAPAAAPGGHAREPQVEVNPGTLEVSDVVEIVFAVAEE
ncbi:MAG: SIMPL domain-containing protein [Actinomycetota bacterium]|nr:SIMPL domain-containing protein [Actinomycetota bacterium]